MLIKKNDKKRKAVAREALIKILNIKEHTDNITEANWQKVANLNSIKKSLRDFVDFVRNRNIISWLGKLNEFGIIEDFCKGKRNLDIESLREYIYTIYGKLMAAADY